jgi:hypothetical protein
VKHLCELAMVQYVLPTAVFRIRIGREFEDIKPLQYDTGVGPRVCEC